MVGRILERALFSLKCQDGTVREGGNGPERADLMKSQLA